jgi:Transposase
MQFRRQEDGNGVWSFMKKLCSFIGKGTHNGRSGQHCEFNARLYGDGCEQVSSPSAKGPCRERQRSMSSPSTSVSDELKVVIMPQNCLGKSGSRVIADSARWSHSSSPARAVPNVVTLAASSARSATQLAILATRGADQLTAEQRVLLDQLSSTCPQLLWMRTLALDFRAALFSKDGQQMCQWITTAKHCGIGSRVRLAFGLQKDLSAVLAAVETLHSNGRVEGQVNRLKMIKRQMYGRAGFCLLLARVLPYKPMAICTPWRAP